MFTNIFMCALGSFFMFFAFFATGMRSALSRRGPSQPISPAGRITFFLAGAAVFVEGFNGFTDDLGSCHRWRLRAVPFAVVTMMAMVLNARRVRTFIGSR